MARQTVRPGCQESVFLFLGHVYYNLFTAQFTLFNVRFNDCLTNAHISHVTTTKIKIRSSPITPRNSLKTISSEKPCVPQPLAATDLHVAFPEYHKNGIIQYVAI